MFYLDPFPDVINQLWTLLTIKYVMLYHAAPLCPDGKDFLWVQKSIHRGF